MADFVLVHGAFRGPWAWDGVAARLRSGGHRVFAPALTAPDATLASYIAEISGVFTANDVTDALLVGHSQGGFMARAASQIVAARVRRLVYLDAPVPAHGEIAFDFRPPGTDPPPVKRGDIIHPRPVIADEWLPEADAAWINERLVAQPVTPSVDPVVLDDPVALAIAETYVFFSATPDVFPCGITRARLDAAGTPYHELTGPHDAVVSHADDVARLLLDELDRG